MKIKPIHQCKTVAELIAAPHRWCRGYSFMSARGKLTSGLFATRFCLLGAVRHVYKSNAGINVANRRLDKALDHSKASDYITFNDNSTHAQVLRLVKKARV